MQVEAIYSQGRIELVEPLNLKRDHVRLIVTVPDDELAPQVNPFNLPPEVLQRAVAMRNRIDAVRHAPLPPDEELPEITAKQLDSQLDRTAAFELRAQMRTEQGRPV